MLIATHTTTIARPVDEVRAQFADIAHHVRARPHENVRFTILDESSTHCEYEQLTRQGPIRIRQRFHLDRSDPAHQVNRVVDGPFRGGTITFDIEATGTDTAVVTASLRTDGVLSRVASPLLRPVLRRALGRALAEDQRDLESGGYAPTEPDRPG